MLERLEALGVTVKLITGDSPVVAQRICRDVGLPDISVDSGTGVARGAADVLNTIGANFGNMATVAAASLFLPFLPLLPSQILLNNSS